ncbi:hypothetical protein CEXT_242681 [Caerostris extrusa]|uniref:Uncharacterized protein n=1 Tax=Caerostris extrusa TaxID=172846 RepID=A0AAV4MPE2_CAEEX|nr:hypothetical protein CEXT_242681 [Caerostris extrusa]
MPFESCGGFQLGYITGLKKTEGFERVPIKDFVRLFGQIHSVVCIGGIAFSPEENVPQINRTAKEDKMLSPKSINLRFCGHFFFFKFCFFLSVTTSPKLLFQSKADDFYVGVEWRLCGFVRGFGDALSKGSERGFQLDVYRP